MKKQHLFSTSIICILAAGTAFSADAETTAPSDASSLASRDVAEHHLDRKGDRIDGRLDRKGNRIDRRLDKKGVRLNARLDRRAGNHSATRNSRGEMGERRGRQHQSRQRTRSGVSQRVSRKRQR
ncbi:MAG: hypothetical protein BMS9Abin01_0269 [Gammaproteobacteria bacterium]|nr:MAG: hypothetical protein BMS9Abin01_0269 [Gammaproteobacteria bacterium]